MCSRNATACRVRAVSYGAVIHAMHHEQDMRRMGGLPTEIPEEQPNE